MSFTTSKAKRHLPGRASKSTGQQHLPITTPLLLNKPTTGTTAHSQHEELHKEKPKNSNPRKRQHSPHSSTHPPAAAPPPIKTKRLPPSHSHSRSQPPRPTTTTSPLSGSPNTPCENSTDGQKKTVVFQHNNLPRRSSVSASQRASNDLPVTAVRTYPTCEAYASSNPYATPRADLIPPVPRRSDRLSR